MLYLVIIGYVLISRLLMGTGYPLGAPDSSCFYGRPSHGNSPQTSATPYQVELDPPERQFYKPEEDIKVTISIKWGDSAFKGVLLQARSVATNGTNSKTVGTFRKHNSYLQTTKLVCEEDGHNALTHSVVTNFWRVSGIWTPPEDYKGEVVFVAAVVKSYETFWVDLQSSPLRPFPPSTPSPTKPGSPTLSAACHQTLLEEIPTQRPHVAILCNTEIDCPCGWKCCPPCDVTEDCYAYAICRKSKKLHVIDDQREEVKEDEEEPEDEVDPSSLELDECC